MHQIAHSQFRIVAGAGLLATVALLPFTIYHVIAGHWYLASIIGALNLLLALASVGVLVCRNLPRRVHRIGYACALMANTVTLLSIQAQGGDTVYWMFPVIFANFYLLPTRAATLLSALFAVLGVLAVAPAVTETHLSRLIVTAALSIFFGIVFSYAISSQRRQLEYLASHDALTSAGNRLAMDRDLADAVERRRRYHERCSVIVFDIDGFKEINDAVGHLRADAIIAELARLFTDRIRAVDRLYRFGGEEFIMLLPHAGERAAWQLAEALRMDVEEHGFAGGTRITVSGGVAELARGEKAGDWLERADSAMFRAKRAGRNRVNLASVPGDEPPDESHGDPSGRRVVPLRSA